MKNGIKQILSVLVVLGLIVTGIGGMSFVTERKDSRNKYEAFYEEKENFEVLFVGQSRMLNGIFPMELWREYGIVSYNLAGHGNRIATNYWLLMNALEYTTPQLVVVDCGLMKLEEKIGTVEQLHLSMDHIPLGKTKLAMIEDLLGDSEQKMDFIWKFSTYHNRWNEVTGEDFVPAVNVEKGAESRVGVAIPAKHVDFGREERLETESLGMVYLRKIIEECREREIKVLLTYVPFPDASGWQIESNTVWEIAGEYGINYLDFHELFAQIDIQTDCHDSDAHLNPSGGWKITDYIGAYIMEHYSVNDQRENPAYAHWHEDYEEYRKFKRKRIQEETDFKSYLSLLYDKEVSFGVWVRPNTSWLNNTAILRLLSNIGIDMEECRYGDVFAVGDRGEEKLTYIGMNGSADTSMGRLGLRINFDTAGMIFDWEETEYLMDAKADAGIMVWETDSRKLIDFKQFTVKEAEGAAIPVN